MDWLSNLETPATALAVLTAMITPAVLISACGALIFSTGTRLGRVIDRVRFLTARFEELARNPEADALAAERRALFYRQLDRQTSRARLIQRAMVAFYTALGTFVATTVAIAITTAVRSRLHLGRGGVRTCRRDVSSLRERSSDHRIANGTGGDPERNGFRRQDQSSLRRRSASTPEGGALTWLGRKIG